jgi:hypothetical protein
MNDRMGETKKKKNITNYANQFIVILIVALIVNLGLYWLPYSMMGIPIKKVDLLSDVRTSPAGSDLDLFAFLNEQDPGASSSDPSPTNNAEPANNVSSTNNAKLTNSAEPTIDQTERVDSSASQTTRDDKNNTNYLLNTQIEDFSANHTSLQRFFAALDNVNNLGRPVRIAFLGDSFIEGDIIVAAFRTKMQERFGGRGVGFVPVTSNVAQYRPTIKHSADGWETYSIIKNRNYKYVLSGMLFEPKSDHASIRLQMVDLCPQLKEVSSLKFIYSKNEQAEMLLKSEADTTLFKLPPTESVTQFEVKNSFTECVLQFKNADGLNAIGVALEDNQGIVVDNFALRGNSGIVMSELNGESCRKLQHLRPYDLIILQYGLNVASDSTLEYGWYRNKMVDVIAHIQDCFPGADILLLSVSDRSHKQGGAYSTMPAVLSLLRAQRQTAQNAEIAFWNTFAAMGGQNSMVKYVDSNWASKDYTHLSFRGGLEIAKMLYDAIITEKKLYDEDERLVEK